MKQEGNRYGLIITNNIYKEKILSNLSLPLKDSNALFKILKKSQIGFFNRICKLENRSSAGVFTTIEKFFTECKKDDLLLFYFSSNCIKDDSGNLYFTAKNTKCNMLRSTAIPVVFIRDLLEESCSEKQIIILDCNFISYFSKDPSDLEKERFDIYNHFEGKGRIVISSSDSVYYTIEKNKITGEGKKLFFTHNIVEGIKTGEADINTDGIITVDELYHYIYDKINEDLPQLTPRILNFDKHTSFIVARSPAGKKRGKKKGKNKYSKDGNLKNTDIPLEELIKPTSTIPRYGWKSIKEGKEYTFFFIYTGIHDHEGIFECSNEFLEKTDNSFKEYLLTYLKNTGGKVWLKKEENYERIIIFPYDGKNTEEPIRFAFRILLYKLLYDFGECLLKDILPIKLAFHFGSTTYYPDPENIILASEDINYLFHLGEFIKPDSLYITEDSKRFVPDSLKKFLIPSGNFEAKELYRLEVNALSH